MWCLVVAFGCRCRYLPDYGLLCVVRRFMMYVCRVLCVAYVVLACGVGCVLCVSWYVCCLMCFSQCLIWVIWFATSLFHVSRFVFSWVLSLCVGCDVTLSLCDVVLWCCYVFVIASV